METVLSSITDIIEMMTIVATVKFVLEICEGGNIII